MIEKWPLIVAGLTAWIGTDMLIPWVTRAAHSLGQLDQPDARKIHTAPIPRLGGVAIYFGFLAALTMVAWLEPALLKHLSNGPILGALVGGTVMFFLGVVDDLVALSPRVKLLVQILAATLAWSFGVSINALTNPFGGMILFPPLVSYLLTVFWIVGITNTINLIDGMDGLAAGVVINAGLIMALVGVSMNQGTTALLALALAGAAIGFLRYNFNPAKIFMGDSGALFLGFMLASLSVTGALKSAAALSIVIVPILALGVPIADTAWAIIRRTAARKPIFSPDRGHLHHRLLDMGMTQRMAATFIYSLSALLGGFALLLVDVTIAQPVLLCAGLALGAILWGIHRLQMDQRPNSQP